jgi:hypothetical protein
MNKILSILLLFAVIVTGLTSLHFFRLSDYNVSALLTITSYVSIVLSIYALSMRKARSEVFRG